MLFHNSSPLRDQAQPTIFSQQFLREQKSRANLRSKMSDGFSQSRASSLAKGFENPAQLGLPKHSPAASSVPIRLIRGKKFPAPPLIAHDFAALDSGPSPLAPACPPATR